MSSRNCVGHLALVGALLHVGAVEALDVAAIEHRRHRTNLFELGPHLIEQRRLEHSSSLGRLVRVVFENVPPAKHNAVK